MERAVELAAAPLNHHLQRKEKMKGQLEVREGAPPPAEEGEEEAGSICGKVMSICPSTLERRLALCVFRVQG